MLKRKKECDIYLTNVCRHRWSRENPVKRSNIELSANTVAFISCRCRLIKVLAGVPRGQNGSKGGGGRVRLVSTSGNLYGFPLFPIVAPVNILVSLLLTSSVFLISHKKVKKKGKSVTPT